MTAIYQEYAPDGDLRPFVECFWSVTTSTAEPAYQVLPDGCLDIVFWPQGGLRAVGTMTAARTASLPPGGCVVGVRFRPGMAGGFLAIPPRELTDRWTPLEAVWGSRGRRLLERLGNADAARGRLAVLATALRPPTHTGNGIVQAIAALVAAGGAADLAAVAREANLSPRQFRRRCLEEAGLSPKHLCRVLRFRRALAALHCGATRGWADVAAECGYYDQAHLIRDFREFSGRTPTRYAMAVFSNPEARGIV